MATNLSTERNRDMNLAQRQSWEVDEINLNVFDYNEDASDTIIDIKNQIISYIQKNNDTIPSRTRQIYSAIYYAIDYYEKLIYLSNSQASSQESFLNHKIEQLNGDLSYLSERFYSKNPNDGPVITISGRIKSLASAMNKIKELINEYNSHINLQETAKAINSKKTGYYDKFIKKNGIYDFRDFNESLRDFFGIEIVVDPPSFIKEQGRQAEIDYVYTVYNYYMEKFDPNSTIPINSKRHPNKKEKVDNSNYQEKDSEHPKIYVPQKRPNYKPIISKIWEATKDYIRNPKDSGYQALHLCIKSKFNFKTTMEHSDILIQPSDSSESYRYEIQLKDAVMKHYATKGDGSHTNGYKKHEKDTIHLHAVPIYLKEVADSFQTIRHQSSDIFNSIKKFIKPEFFKIPSIQKLSLDKAFEEFYGITFLDYFKINYEQFKHEIKKDDRIAILTGKKEIQYDENDNLQIVDRVPTHVITKKDISGIDLVEYDAILAGQAYYVQTSEERVELIQSYPYTIVYPDEDSNKSNQDSQENPQQSPKQLTKKPYTKPEITSPDDIDK